MCLICPQAGEGQAGAQGTMTKRPPTSGARPAPGGTVARRAAVKRPAGSSRPASGGGGGGGGAGILRFYTDDAPGLKMCARPRALKLRGQPASVSGCLTATLCVRGSGPTTVLVLSLLFIAFVVLLHIWGKFRKG